MQNLKFKILTYLLFFSMLSIVMVSCNNRPEGVLKQSKMVVFLTDLHKLDGSLTAKGMGATQDRENVYYYNALLEKYGITKAEFDSSLVWYTKNPKKFEKIYAQVVDQLHIEDSIVKQKRFAYEDSLQNAVKQIDIWNKPQRFTLNADSTRTKIDFEIISGGLYPYDIYELKFLLRIAPSDSSLNQYAVFRIHYTNGLTDSVYVKTINDSILRHYNLHLVARYKQKIERLTGSLLGSSTYKGVQKSLVDSVTLTREYSPKIQEKMILELEELHTGVKKADSLQTRLPHMPKSIPPHKTEKTQKIK